MKRYEIEIPVEAVASYTVMAESEEEAIELVLSGEAEFDDYVCHDEDRDTNNWEVNEAIWQD